MTVGTHLVLVYANRTAPTGTAVDITCLVDAVSVNHGRQDTATQPEASAATVDITVGPGTPLPAAVDMGAWLVVKTTVGGTTYTRFTGRITDVSLGWDDAGEHTPDTGVGQIVAMSTLADYARRVIGDEPFPQELDGARVARIFALAGLTLDPFTSDPGRVEVIPRDVDKRAALEVATATADSAGGLIWETRDGAIRYADSEHRRGTPVTLELDACDILVTPTWQRNLSGLVNEIAIGYGAPPEDDPGGSPPPPYVDSNPGSVAKWGRYQYSVTTELAREADAQSMAWLILAQNSGPVWMLQNLPVDVAQLSTAATQTLLALELHHLLRVTGLPATGQTPTSVVAWVEGWTERLEWGVHELELSVSDYCRTSPPPRWDDVSTSTTWDTADPATTWDKAACTGGPLPDLGRWDDVSASVRWDAVDTSLAWDAAGAGVPA